MNTKITRLIIFLGVVFILSALYYPITANHVSPKRFSHSVYKPIIIHPSLIQKPCNSIVYYPNSCCKKRYKPHVSLLDYLTIIWNSIEMHVVSSMKLFVYCTGILYNCGLFVANCVMRLLILCRIKYIFNTIYTIIMRIMRLIFQIIKLSFNSLYLMGHYFSSYFQRLVMSEVEIICIKSRFRMKIVPLSTCRTTSELQNIINTHFNLSSGTYNIAFRNRLLQHRFQYLSDYNIKHGDVLHVLIRSENTLTGGARRKQTELPVQNTIPRQQSPNSYLSQEDINAGVAGPFIFRNRVIFDCYHYIKNKSDADSEAKRLDYYKEYRDKVKDHIITDPSSGIDYFTVLGLIIILYDQKLTPSDQMSSLKRKMDKFFIKGRNLGGIPDATDAHDDNNKFSKRIRDRYSTGKNLQFSHV